MRVLKSSGELVPYNPDKIRASLLRIGATPELAESVLAEVEKKLRDGMTTREIYSLLRARLREANPGIASRYNLRSALLRLGPSGFNFEKYVAAVLSAYAYDASLPARELSGLCVDHEVDVIARKDGRTAFIEAKFRNVIDDVVNLKDAMATWARFMDLLDGSVAGRCEKFDEAWIVTNGRFSGRAQQFGVCKGVHMVSWSGSDHSLARMVDHASLYPITVLDSVTAEELSRFADGDLMLCRDISEQTPKKIAAAAGLEEARAGEIIGLCQQIVGSAK